MKEIKIYNTLTNKKEVFKPLKPDHVGIYVCGPTVYDLSHIGHGRSSVAFDVIFKYFKYIGYSVNYTRNYTDVDDKIINKANAEGLDSKVVAEKYIHEFDVDMDSLGVAIPTNRPKATESMAEIIDVIEKLIKKGFAYQIEDGVYYSVRKFEGYGKLSGKNIDDLESGARVDIDSNKQDPLDFALWKKSKAGEPFWSSPWGDGRPGWHIECTAMSMNLLGETIDIHGGGKDLTFPHHENEIAQSEAVTGKTFANYWVHNGFVNIEKEKMSKSIGNILNIRDALSEHSAESIRLFLLSSHYRSPIDYTAQSLKDSEVAVERYYRSIARLEDDFKETTTIKINKEELNKKMEPIFNAMGDDFNTALAIGKIFDECSSANKIMDSASGGFSSLTEENKNNLALTYNLFVESNKFLGIFIKTASQYFKSLKSGSSVDSKEIEDLIVERKLARDNKDFKKADEIRDNLLEKGIVLEDKSTGTVWTVKKV